MVNRINTGNRNLVCLSTRLSAFIAVFAGLLWLFPAWVTADQNDPQLESLFESLQQAKSNAETKRIENAIWQIWLDAPDEHASDLLSQVSFAMSQGQNRLALQLSNQLVDSSPEFAEAWNKRATIQYLLGNHGLSVADIKETLLLEPRHFGALSGLGMIFLRSGNYEAALDAFKRVLQISPASENAQGSIARVQSMIGQEI